MSIVLLIFIQFLRILLTGLFTKLTLQAFEKKITISETNYLSIVTTAGNFFGPLLGGTSIRAVYLKNKHKFQYSKFMSTLYGYYLITFTTYSLIGMLALSVVYVQFGSLDGMKLVGLFLLATFSAGTIALSLPTKYGYMLSGIRIMKLLRKQIVTAVDGWGLIRKHPGLVHRLIILSVAVLGVASLESLVLYRLFSTDVFLPSVILYTALGAFSMLISITPGAIGIKEGFYLLISSTLLLDNTQVIQMATVDRSVTFIILIFMLVLTKTKLFSPSEKYSDKRGDNA